MQDTDSATWEFFPARSSTAGERFSLPPLVEFSLPLYQRSNDRDFFFLGDDDELVTGAETSASAREREVFDRAFSRVS